MDTRDLRIFSVTYESNSFNSAAAKIYITPQGLAKVINKLETELDVPLFVRSVNGISPTIYGTNLYHKVRDLDYLLHEVSSLKGSYSTSKTALSIYATNGAFYYLGYEFFYEYQKAHSNITFNLVEVPDSFLNDQFLERKYHLGFLTGPVNPELFDSIFVSTVSQCVIMHPDNPLAKLDTLKPSDLQGVPTALLGREYSSFSAHYSMMIDHELSPTIVLETSNDSLIFEFAAKNHGVGFVQKSLLNRTVVKSAVESGVVVAKDLNDVDMSKDIYFVSNKNIELTPEEIAFKQYVKSCMEVSSMQ